MKKSSLTPEKLMSRVGVNKYDKDFYLGNLDLRGYDHPLPPWLKGVIGKVNLRGYSYQLPDSFRITGEAKLGGYPYALRPTQTVGSVDVRGYEHALPDSIVFLGGIRGLPAYRFPLPKNLKIIDGEALLHDPSSGETYQFRLPEGLIQFGGDVAYDPRRPNFKNVIDLSKYKHPLPTSLEVLGGTTIISGYQFPVGPQVSIRGKVIGWRSYPFEPPARHLDEHYEITKPSGENFKKWFKKSRVVDKNGNPLVVYTGVYSGGFSSFDLGRTKPPHRHFYFTDSIDVASTYVPWDEEQPGSGHYDFRKGADIIDPTPPIGSPERHDRYGIYRVYLSLQNPAIVDAKSRSWANLSFAAFPGLNETWKIADEAQKRGYDGVIFKNISDRGMQRPAWPGPSTVYVAFYPTQIKSALFNTGEFSPTDPDIRKNPRRRKTSKRARRTSRSWT